MDYSTPVWNNLSPLVDRANMHFARFLRNLFLCQKLQRGRERSLRIITCVPSIHFLFALFPGVIKGTRAERQEEAFVCFWSLNGRKKKMLILKKNYNAFWKSLAFFIMINIIVVHRSRLYSIISISAACI